MKKQHLLTLILAAFFIVISVHGVDAQTGNPMSISGDEICGASSSTECSLVDAKNIIGNFIRSVVEIVIPLLLVLIIGRFLWAYKELSVDGNENAYKVAKKQIGSSLVGFIILLLLTSSFLLAVLKLLGLQDWTTTFVRLISEAFVPHAYATEQALLPNALGTNSLYDAILQLVRVAVRWFVYPAVVFMWVSSGFAYVLAQGNPEKITKAHNWLLWAVISTVIVFMTEGFLFAIRATVNQILP